MIEPISSNILHQSPTYQFSEITARTVNYFTAPSVEVGDVWLTRVRPALFFLAVSVHPSVHRFCSGMPSECPSRLADDVAGRSLQQPVLYPV